MRLWIGTYTPVGEPEGLRDEAEEDVRGMAIGLDMTVTCGLIAGIFKAGTSNSAVEVYDD